MIQLLPFGVLAGCVRLSHGCIPGCFNRRPHPHKSLTIWQRRDFPKAEVQTMLQIGILATAVAFQGRLPRVRLHGERACNCNCFLIAARQHFNILSGIPSQPGAILARSQYFLVGNLEFALLLFETSFHDLRSELNNARLVTTR